MSTLTLLIIAAIIIWLISMTGGFFALYLRKKYHAEHRIVYLAESFAGGIFLGAALFHMLPDAASALRTIYPTFHFPLANLICAAGFCVLLSFQKITEHYSETRETHSPNLVPLLLTAMISIHALSEGIALGVTQQLASLIIIFIAIAVHKSSEGFAVGMQLQRGTLSLSKVVLSFIFFSLMSPLGVTLGALAHEVVTGKNSELLTGIFNAFAAGTFLYIATLHKLHHKHEGAQIGELILTLVGLSIMAVVAVWM